MSKKIVNIISIVLLLFVGFVALTQESELAPSENNFESQENEDRIAISTLNPKEPARWFKSNSGGLAIKEIKSRIIALRNEYALSIESASPDEMPDYVHEFYKEEYSIERRILYKNAKQNRVQWLFRDANNKIKLIAVIFESLEERVVTVINRDTEEEQAAEVTEITEAAEVTEAKEDEDSNDITVEEEIVKVKETRIELVERKTGFIEIYDDEANLSTEYTYYKNGDINRIDFEYNNNLLIIAASFYSQQEDEGNYIKTFTDFYWYNRSLALRSIERIFHKDIQAKEDDIVKISFPRNIRNMSNSDLLINERLNLYPAFFGEVYIEGDSKMVYDIDNRGRVLKQTLISKEEEVIWTITNTWHNNRIILTEKNEGELRLTAEYNYNSAGDKILEKNFNNGVLERTIVADGNLEIEELYLNNVVILRAIWEEGIKISETRVK